MSDTIATITLDTTQNSIKQITPTQNQFKFQCKRCAALCCKLGGPPLTKKETKQIEQEGYKVEDFLEPTTNPELHHTVGVLKSNKDGSCIFLKHDPKQNRYQCSIYNVRPNLCRIYPFKLEKLDSTTFALKIIPCCTGLNNPEGETVDERFIINLLEPLLEATKTLH